MTIVNRYGSLILPLVIWIASTQWGQILPHADCRGGVPWTALATLTSALIALAYVLYSMLRSDRQPGRTGTFLATTSRLIGLTLCFALLLQATASILVNPCLR